MPSPVSAAVLTRNEEANIGRCLDSLDWADEVVVVDSESTDRTREIAESKGARVIVRPWHGGGEQYQFAVSNARSRWVLVVDADEEVSEELGREISEVLAKDPTEAAFRVTRLNCVLGRWLRFGGWRESEVRLLDKERTRYLRRVHPRVAVDGRLGRLRGSIRHHVAPDLGEWWMRAVRIARIEAETAYVEGRRFSGWRVVGGFLKFLRRYMLRLGFLDGWAGLFASLSRFVYVAVQQASLLELQRGVRTASADPMRRTFR